MLPDFDSIDISEMAKISESKLKGDVDRNEVASKLLQQALNDRTQRHWQRKILFLTVMLIVPAAIIVTVVMMGALMFTREVGDAVYIAFISAMAVQSFALIATLARNLYRDETSPERETAAPPQ